MARRVLLICGILSPTIYAVADGASGIGWRDYSFWNQTISELGAIGAPSRVLFTTLLVPAYLLFLGFGVGVWKSANGRPRVRVLAALLVGLGVLALGVGLFVPMRPRGTDQGLSGTLHLVEGGAWMLGLMVAMGFAASAFGKRFRRYTIGTMALIILFLFWTGIHGPRLAAGLPTPGLGVIERTWWYAYQLWFIVLAVRLLREPSLTRTYEVGNVA